MIPPLKFQRLQPVIFIHDTVYVPGGDEGRVELATTSGRLPMRPLCPISVVAQHCRREGLNGLLKEAFGYEDPAHLQEDQVLALFLESIVPRFAQWLEKGITNEPATASGLFDDIGVRLARTIPTPVLPQPSVLILGRLWLLNEAPSRSRVFVLALGQKLTITGEFVSTRRLTEQWHEIAIA